MDFTLNFFESARAIPIFLEDPEILTAYLKDLGLGMLFTALGVISYLASREKKMKKIAAENATKAEAETAAETEHENDFE